MIKEKNENAVNLGKKGGMSNFIKYGKKHMQEIGKRGCQSRWKKHYKLNPNK